MKWGKTWTQTQDAHARNENTNTQKEKTRGKKKTNISEFKTNREPAQAHKHTRARTGRDDGL